MRAGVSLPEIQRDVEKRLERSVAAVRPDETRASVIPDTLASVADRGELFDGIVADVGK